MLAVDLPPGAHASAKATKERRRSGKPGGPRTNNVPRGLGVLSVRHRKKWEKESVGEI